VEGTLWLVGTPIGNLADVTERARTTLETVDVIAAEDTRHTGRLLRSLGIAPRPPMVSYFEGNELERTDELVERLRAGEDVALVTDGGMPGISDPGFRLVRACVEGGIPVGVVPGPSSVLAALVVSGLPTDRFSFEGFLPKKPGERAARLARLAREDRTLVLFESPRRLRALLRDVAGTMGDRRVAVARELTKLHEEVLRGRASELLEHLGDADPKGEVVVVIAGAGPPEIPSVEAMAAEARALIEAGARSRDAAREVAASHGASANAIYRALVGG
jgi:16S rRNA (cytidine1402-2'-O)-methyltransferase